MTGQTIELRGYKVDGERVFTKKEAGEILGIFHPYTLRGHMEALKITSTLGWQGIREILALNLFLKARVGYHSRTMYANLRLMDGALDKVFDHYAINVDKEFRNLYEQYNQRTQAIQISSAIPRARGADGRFTKSRKPKQRRAS